MNFQSKSIAAVLLVVASLALGYFGVLPRWQSYTASKAQLSAAKETQAKLQAAQKQLESFLSEYKSHSADAEAINKALPLTQTQVYNVLKNLDDLSKSSGMALGALTVNESQATDQLGAAANTIHPIEISFNISGNSIQFKDFLAKLESNLRIIDLQTLTTESEDNGTSGSGSTGSAIKYTLKLRSYYQK